jgi:hypothetical protein
MWRVRASRPTYDIRKPEVLSREKTEEALNKDLSLSLDSGRIRLCEAPCGADAALFRDFQNECFVPETPHHILRPQMHLEQLHEPPKHRVTGGMPVGFVNPLKMLQIKKDHGAKQKSAPSFLTWDILRRACSVSLYDTENYRCRVSALSDRLYAIYFLLFW